MREAFTHKAQEITKKKMKERVKTMDKLKPAPWTSKHYIFDSPHHAQASAKVPLYLWCFFTFVLFPLQWGYRSFFVLCPQYY